MAKTTDNRTTDSLNEALTKTNPEDLDAFLEANAEKMLTQKKPFAAFMREKFREKSISQQRVFLAADTQKTMVISSSLKKNIPVSEIPF